MKGLLLAPAALFVLAACSPGSDEAEESAPVAAPTVEADGGVDTEAAAPEPVVVDEIPAAFFGVWDYVKGNCNPNSDLRVEIGPQTIGFYESHGEVTRVEVKSPEEIVAGLAMEGEGEKWQSKTLYTLDDDGTRLTAASADERQFEPLTLKRCE